MTDKLADLPKHPAVAFHCPVCKDVWARDIGDWVTFDGRWTHQDALCPLHRSPPCPEDKQR